MYVQNLRSQNMAPNWWGEHLTLISFNKDNIDYHMHLSLKQIYRVYTRNEISMWKKLYGTFTLSCTGNICSCVLQSTRTDYLTDVGMHRMRQK